MPTKRTINQIKYNLLRPALTSHFEVQIPVPQKLIRDGNTTFLQDNGVFLDQTKLNLLCSEATLPGSNLATLEITNDFHGVTERHPYRRVYDDRIDLTFYVDANNYLPIRFFETWMKFIVDESIATQPERGVGSESPNYFYRVRYPEDYLAKRGLRVVKFERDYSSTLEYEFINSFPVSVTSIPISYESSSLLKCTVSMSYIRYILRPGIPVKETNDIGPLNSSPAPVDAARPATQAEFNSQSLGRVITNEYYNNFGDNRQNSTNTGDFFNGSVGGPFGTAIG